MSGFSADWLALRQVADDHARDQRLMQMAIQSAAGGDALVTDLGGGSGATMRVLAPHLPDARWRILDYDPDLLALIETSDHITTQVTDLAHEPEAAFKDNPDLITASAFFDLVSAAWIDRFTAHLQHARIPLYAALTYDGRETWLPTPHAEPDALAAFHADMQQDKGFGPALGPNGADYLASALDRIGYEVVITPSDWTLSRDRDDAMINALASGGIDALRTALSPDDHEQWARGRRAAASVMVGHQDIFAAPKAG